MSEFYFTKLNTVIDVPEIITVHYFEHAKDYIFHGERHNFWELLYVDKGKAEVIAEKEGFELNQGEMIFHQPNEYHNVWANGKIAPNLVVITFTCQSPAMDFFRGKIITIGTEEKEILGKIIKESKDVFESDLGDPFIKGLQRRKEYDLGAEQYIKILLELMLLNLLRSGSAAQQNKSPSKTTKERFDNKNVESIIKYLGDNIYNRITFIDVLEFSNIGSTHLKTLFKQKTGESVMGYYRNLKIDAAKTMIREEVYNITEIADKLSYKSVHHFSKQFKDITGMSPTEYSRSVKALF